MEIMTVRDVSKALNIGINQAYELVKRPDFPSFRLGRAYKIDKEKFEKWVRNQEKM